MAKFISFKSLKVLKSNKAQFCKKKQDTAIINPNLIKVRIHPKQTNHQTPKTCHPKKHAEQDIKMKVTSKKKQWSIDVNLSCHIKCVPYLHKKNSSFSFSSCFAQIKRKEMI